MYDSPKSKKHSVSKFTIKKIRSKGNKLNLAFPKWYTVKVWDAHNAVKVMQGVRAELLPCFEFCFVFPGKDVLAYPRSSCKQLLLEKCIALEAGCSPKSKEWIVSGSVQMLPASVLRCCFSRVVWPMVISHDSEIESPRSEAIYLYIRDQQQSKLHALLVNTQKYLAGCCQKQKAGLGGHTRLLLWGISGHPCEKPVSFSKQKLVKFMQRFLEFVSYYFFWHKNQVFGLPALHTQGPNGLLPVIQHLSFSSTKLSFKGRDSLKDSLTDH